MKTRSGAGLETEREGEFMCFLATWRGPDAWSGLLEQEDHREVLVRRWEAEGRDISALSLLRT